MVVMKGEQWYHNNPSELLEGLYLCAARAINSKVMKDLGITCVINATLELPTFAYQNQDCMQIAVEDRVGAKLYVYFDMVADKMHNVLNKSGGRVMIYCRAGMSRSATLCIYYFMKHHSMTFDEAFQFVKQRRPIIHPNAGFLKQLREYESKLRFRRSGIKRKYEADEFSYATVEEVENAFEALDFDELEKIKARPKPRIMKPKLISPDECAAFEIAQSYQITEVGIARKVAAFNNVENEGGSDTTANTSNRKQPLAVPTTSSSHSRGSSQKSTSNSASAAGTRPKIGPRSGYSGLRRSGSRVGTVPKAQTIERPKTPILPPHQHNVAVIHDPLSVAETIAETPMEASSPGLLTPKGSVKKRPFSKISEPAKVAVSFLTFPLGLCSPFEGKKAADNFTAEIPHYSVFADIHLPLVQKPEEVLFQCPISLQTMVIPTNTTTSPTAAATATATTTTTTCRARTLVAPLRCGPPSSHTPVICECPGLYQKLDQTLVPVPASSSSSATKQASTSAVGQNHIPSRFGGTRGSTVAPAAAASKPGGLSRFGTSRSSIKLNSGLKISPMPDTHRKRPVPNLDLDFRIVALQREPPIKLEKVVNNSKIVFNPKFVKAKKVLWCPNLVLASTLVQKDQILDRVIKDPNLSFKLNYFLTLPMRTVILNPSGYVQVNQVLSWSNTEVLPVEKSVMPQKEYPYYSPARRPSFILEMMTAQESPNPKIKEVPKVVAPVVPPVITNVVPVPVVTKVKPGHFLQVNKEPPLPPKEEQAAQKTKEASIPYSEPTPQQQQPIKAKFPANNPLVVGSKVPVPENTNSVSKVPVVVVVPTATTTSSSGQQQAPISVENVKEIIPAKIKVLHSKIKIKEPDLNWAAARCEFDPFQNIAEARPMEDLLPREKAKILFQKSISDFKYRSGACIINDQIIYSDEKLENMARFHMPEKYKTFMIQRMNFWPLYEVATCHLENSCQNVNLYCEPTPFKAWAKVIFHQQQVHNNKSSSDDETTPIQGGVPDEKMANHQREMHVASCQTATSNDNLTELVAIPDVVGDISKIQPLLIKQKDPAKMLIWMEVFKRSVIKARPIRPFVKVCEMLPVAQCRHIMVNWDCTAFSRIPPTIPTARALVTIVSDTTSKTNKTGIPIDVMMINNNNDRIQQQQQHSFSKNQQPQYAVEITDCFVADKIHAFNPRLAKIQFIALRQKAVETTEYIRNYTLNQWNSAMEENCIETWSKTMPNNNNLHSHLLVRAHRIMYMPLCHALEYQPEIHGLVEDFLTSGLDGVPSEWLSRQPFRKIAPLHQLVEITEYPALLCSSELLPISELIQDVEEFPNVSIIQEYFGLGQALVSGPVDSFWFFQLDPRSKVEVQAGGTAATVPSSVPSLPLSDNQSNIGAGNGSGADEDYEDELIDDLPHDMPFAKPGSFQLFLPDPEMMDRVGTLRDITSDHEQQILDSKEAEATSSSSSSTSNQEKTTKISGPESTTRNSDESKQRVMFADPPVSGSQECPPLMLNDRIQVESRSKSEATKSRLVSYQKIRDRSHSRNTRFAAATQQVNSTLSEKRTLDNLNASMKAASEILERRRSERRGTAYSGTGSTSRYVGADYSLPFPPDHFGTGATERGRPTSRYSLPMQPPPTKSYRSSSGSVDTSGSAGSGSSSHHATSGAGGTGTGNSLWGLLDMAQSWIMTHTSRRDRSEERSRYLLRKTKPV